MQNDILNQFYIFFIFILMGALIGIIFDIFRVLRKSFKTSDLVTYIQDTIFAIITLIVLIYSIFIFNNGELRFFVFLGIAIGLLIYIMLLSKLFIKVNVKIIYIIKNLVKSIFYILSYPLKIIFKVFRKKFIKPVTFVFINFNKSLSNFIKKMSKNTKKIKIKKDFT